jgi:hypothetical protein
MRYYKTEWKYCNNYCEDGGKYLTSKYALMFLPEDDRVFELAVKCKNVYEGNSDNSGSDGDNSSGSGSDSDSGSYSVSEDDNNILESISDMFDNRKEISYEEYQSCKKVMGNGVKIHCSADNGGMSFGDTPNLSLIQEMEYVLKKNVRNIK